MRASSEAEVLQEALEQLSLADAPKGTPLRRLEKTLQRGQRVLACSQEQLPSFLEEANRLREEGGHKQTVKIALENQGLRVDTNLICREFGIA